MQSFISFFASISVEEMDIIGIKNKKEMKRKWDKLIDYIHERGANVVGGTFKFSPNGEWLLSEFGEHPQEMHVFYYADWQNGQIKPYRNLIHNVDGLASKRDQHGLMLYDMLCEWNPDYPCTLRWTTWDRDQGISEDPWLSLFDMRLTRTVLLELLQPLQSWIGGRDICGLVADFVIMDFQQALDIAENHFDCGSDRIKEKWEIVAKWNKKQRIE